MNLEESIVFFKFCRECDNFESWMNDKVGVRFVHEYTPLQEHSQKFDWGWVRFGGFALKFFVFYYSFRF